MRNPPDVPGVRSQRTRFQKLLAYLKRYWFLYLLVLPGFVFMIVFNYGPMYGIQLAFKDYHANLGIWGSPWVGLEHFREMIADANFWRAAKNTLIINGYNIVFKTTFTIFLALMLNELRLKKVKSCVQTAAYLPYFLSWVIFAGLVQVFLEYPSSSGSSGGAGQCGGEDAIRQRRKIAAGKRPPPFDVNRRSPRALDTPAAAVQEVGKVRDLRLPRRAPQDGGASGAGSGQQQRLRRPHAGEAEGEVCPVESPRRGQHQLSRPGVQLLCPHPGQTFQM